MSRRTEDDDARDLITDLNNRGFRVCELVPVTNATYLDGDGDKEWSPIDDKRAVRVLTQLLLVTGER